MEQLVTLASTKPADVIRIQGLIPNVKVIVVPAVVTITGYRSVKTMRDP